MASFESRRDACGVRHLLACFINMSEGNRRLLIEIMGKRKLPPTEDPQLYSGLIRLHVLHHAAQKPVFGRWLIEELRRHGYTLSAGTLYPMLHAMERKGYLHSFEERSGKLRRRFYHATTAGEKALEGAERKVQELFSELLSERRPRATRKIARPRP